MTKTAFSPACAFAIAWLVIIPLLWPLLPLSAYSGFDDVLVIEPTWTTLPTEPLTAGDGITYRVRALSAERVAVEVRNLSAQPLTAALRLPAYQATDAAAAELSAAAGATATVEIAVTRSDRDCTESAVRFEQLTLGKVVLTVRPSAGARPPTERAFAVHTAWENAGFRADAVAYTAIAHDDHTIDLHVLNRSSQVIHADFRVLGWQPDGALNPRLHLLPGVAIEILIPGTAVDARVTAATVAVWMVRLNDDDTGPALGERADDARALLPVDDDWRATGLSDDALAGFNPQALVHRFTSAGLEVRNRSDRIIAASLEITGVSPPPARLPIDLPAGAAVTLPWTGAASVNVIAHEMRLDGTALRATTLVIAAPPATALPVLPQTPDARFNSLTVVYALARQGDRQARLTLVNRAAIALHADWFLPAYRSASNPRLHLPAGASVTLTIDVERSDVRLPLAQVLLANVRLGLDQGENKGDLLCVAPAP